MVALSWLGNIEPALDDMPSEDIVLALMARRGMSPEIVRNLLESVARSRDHRWLVYPGLGNRD
jgi:hypothetical protein